jgi:hypothetical protein
MRDDEWSEAIDRMQRALRLGAQIGRGNGDHYHHSVSQIKDALDPASSLLVPPWAAIELLELLAEFNEGDSAKYANLSEQLAVAFAADGNWCQAKPCWDLKAKWHVLEKDQNAERAARLRSAETFEGLAKEALEQSDPNFSLVCHHLEDAIQAFRRLGESGRAEQLHQQMIKYQGNVRAQMGRIEHEIDLRDAVHWAISIVRGRTLEDAVFSLLAAGPVINVEDVRKAVEEQGLATPIQHLIATVSVNDDGRTIARRPSRFSSDPDEVAGAVRADMFADAAFTQQMFAVGVIESARRQIVLEHPVRERNVMELLRDSPWIAEGRAPLVARALHAGFNGDFVIATHLIVPQIEHSLRYGLSQIGVITSDIDDPTGTQEEQNINALLFVPELRRLMPEDMIFELQGLLIERFGFNLRNRIAHGLLSTSGFGAPAHRYLWWMALRMYCLPMLMARNSARGEAVAHSEATKLSET